MNKIEMYVIMPCIWPKVGWMIAGCQAPPHKVLARNSMLVAKNGGHKWGDEISKSRKHGQEKCSSTGILGA